MSTEQQNMELMQTLDDAWNAQDVGVFRKRHKDHVVVAWPGGNPPTQGIDAHVAESEKEEKKKKKKKKKKNLARPLPDQKLDNRPYRVFFASGDWTCSIARFRGTFSGPMKGPDGKDFRRLASRSKWISARSPTGKMARSRRRTSSTTWSAS